MNITSGPAEIIVEFEFTRMEISMQKLAPVLKKMGWSPPAPCEIKNCSGVALFSEEFGEPAYCETHAIQFNNIYGFAKYQRRESK